jgi:arabinoxylan arabinofuranohydrolase
MRHGFVVHSPAVRRVLFIKYLFPLLGLAALAGCSGSEDTGPEGEPSSNSGGAGGGSGGNGGSGTGGVGSGGVGSGGVGTGGLGAGGNGVGGTGAGGTGGDVVGDTGGADGAGGLPASDCVPQGKAQNPLVTQIFTADPNAIVYGDRIYVYVSHDADGQDGFEMIDHHVYSSDDMANWQDHGVAIRAADLSWAGVLYAPTACEKDGTYYMYLTNGGSQIGVAVSDNPGGPFVDPLGNGFLSGSFPNANVAWLFDPACFIDDDGQAYLYFGGGPSGQNARVVRLTDDMLGIKDTSATTIQTTAFFEASFMHKHNGKYYFSYSSDFSPGHGATLEYYIGDSPLMSGSEYKGVLLNNGGINNGNNSHGSILEFQGKSYLFYHNRKLTQDIGNNNTYERSIAVQELTYAEDGTINTLSMSTEDGTVDQIKCLDAFTEVEAERFARASGIEVEGDAGETVRLADIDDGDFIAYSQVDFREGATALVFQVASGASGNTIDVVLDGCLGDAEGTSVGTCDVMSTGGGDTFAELRCAIDAAGGPHDLCLKFSGGDFEIDSFHLE